MERLRGKCAMLGLLDRTTKLTSSHGENGSIPLEIGIVRAGRHTRLDLSYYLKV